MKVLDKMSKKTFITGASDDAASSAFLELLSDEEISSYLGKAVCIKVENGSQTCSQFSQLYPVVLVPSIYFIDSQTAVNIETTGGNLDKDKLMTSIHKAFGESGGGGADSVMSPREERVENARQALQTAVNPDLNQSTLPSTPTTSLSLEEKVERAKRLLAENKALKAKEEAEKDKNGEAERRNLGKNIQAMKQKQADDEIRKAAEERQKEKEEQRLAKQKIMEQIAQDRAERAEKYKKEKDERDEKMKEKQRQKLVAEAEKAEKMAAERASVARIQFRLPNGVTQNHRFDPEQTIGDLYTFVIDEMTTPYGAAISLSTTFPSRELDQEEKNKTLRDAQLVPSTTILILPKNRGTSMANPSANIFTYIMVWITSFFGWLSGMFFGGQPSEANRQGPRSTGGSSSHQGSHDRSNA